MRAAKYWRLSNIRTKGGVVDYGISFSKIAFVDPSTPSPSISSSFSKSTYAGRGAANAFDGNIATHAHNSSSYSSEKAEYFIGCQFSAPYAPTTVGVQMRQDIAQVPAQLITDAIVESSLDGNTWQVEGAAHFTLPSDQSVYQEVDILPIDYSDSSKHRHWRVTNVIMRESFPNFGGGSVSVWELDFNTLEDFPAKNTRNVSANHWYGMDGSNNDWHYTNAFDGKSGYNDKGAHAFGQEGLPQWALSYDFIYPVSVKSLSVKMRQQGSFAYRDWISAEVQHSDNGVDWVTAGYVSYTIRNPEPDFNNKPFYTSGIYSRRLALDLVEGKALAGSASTFSTGKTKPVLASLGYKRNASVETTPSPFRTYSFFDPYVMKAVESTLGRGLYGYIAGTIYERVTATAPKLPVQRRVYLYNQASGQLIATTWSAKNGAYLFTGLSVDSWFMIVSVDHNGKWGLEGGAFKIAKRSVFDGITVQYPRD